MGNFAASDLMMWLGINAGMCFVLALIWIPSHRHKQRDDEADASESNL